MDIPCITIAEANELFFQRELSPVELVQSCLDRIAKLNPSLNVWITVAAESALAQARAAEERLMHDFRLSPLDGIPIGLKDNIDTAGMLTTAASNLFRDRIPTTDAAVVRQLLRAGAVILGKLNLHEFAYGGSNVVSAFGPTRNPWNHAHMTGGSSGGAAAAVASGMCLAAIGTDTAGSIRLPAACCGVVGLKPTYGLVSTVGVIPLSWSLDHVGPITQTVEDAALLMDVLVRDLGSDLGSDLGNDGLAGGPGEMGDLGIGGSDSNIATFLPDEPELSAAALGPLRSRMNTASALASTRSPYNAFAERLSEARQRGDIVGMRLGVPKDHFLQDLDASVADAFQQALEVIRNFEAEIEILEVDMPANPDRTVQAAESYAYHEQCAGQGEMDAGEYDRFADPNLVVGRTARPQDYQPETLRRIRSGAAIRASDYIRARLAMDAATEQSEMIFSQVNAIITPTSPIPAPAFAQVDAALEQLRPLEVSMLRNTRPFNVLGLPAISVPCGFTPSGLPIGLQIAARHHNEDTVLALADAFEQATEWHTHRPKLF